jgi:hypothetical protein
MTKLIGLPAVISYAAGLMASGFNSTVARTASMMATALLGACLEGRVTY